MNNSTAKNHILFTPPFACIPSTTTFSLSSLKLLLIIWIITRCEVSTLLLVTREAGLDICSAYPKISPIFPFYEFLYIGVISTLFCITSLIFSPQNELITKISTFEMFIFLDMTTRIVLIEK